jgi:hypothetical protein
MLTIKAIIMTIEYSHKSIPLVGVVVLGGYIFLGILVFGLSTLDKRPNILSQNTSKSNRRTPAVRIMMKPTNINTRRTLTNIGVIF